MQKTIKKGLMLKLFLLMFAGIVAVGFSGCTSKKKLAAQQAATERLEIIESAKQDLLRVINDNGSMTIAEKEDIVSEVKGMNIGDPEVDGLIVEAEKIIADLRKEELKVREQVQKEELERLEMERKYEKIEEYFDAVANSKSMAMADPYISDALKFFASPDVPVLPIIHIEGGLKDYDRPTTIKKYLEYLKDQGKNMNEIYNVVFDQNGKITELELIKK
jgi:outer membrane lipoprotein-sorting protein